jgi:hypothetical protein
MPGGIYVIIGDDELHELLEAAYDSEAILQELLAKYPGLLSGDRSEDSPRRWLLVAREMGLPGEEQAADRWSVDHLFLDDQGVPTLVEVKRSSDTRVRREVVGQMLDYAANAVRYWPVETIRARFESRCQADGLDPVATVSQLLDAEADPESFWQQVKTNFQAGRLRLVFVADKIPAELRRVVEFLNEQMNPTEVLALEVPQFVGEGIRSLVPRLVGRTAKAEGTKGPTPARRQWDEVSFLTEFEKRGPDEHSAAGRILGWTAMQNLRPWWGTGSQLGSFIPVLDLPEGPGLTLFTLWTNGTVEVRYGFYGPPRPPFDQIEKRRELVERLNRIPGVVLPESFIAKGVSKTFPLAALLPYDNMTQFLRAMDWALNELSVAHGGVAMPLGSGELERPEMSKRGGVALEWLKKHGLDEEKVDLIIRELGEYRTFEQTSLWIKAAVIKAEEEMKAAGKWKESYSQ